MFGTAIAGDRCSAPNRVEAATSSAFAVSEAASRSVAGHCAQIFVQAPQQIDQHLLLAFVQARQQSPLPLECRNDHLVMRRASLRRQRDRMRATIPGVLSDGDQAALPHDGQRATDRALVETDDGANARGGNAGLDRKQRHDPPLGDVDAEIALVERGRAVRELVGDEGDEGRNVPVEVERRTFMRGRRRRLLARFGRGRAGSHMFDRGSRRVNES